MILGTLIPELGFLLFGSQLNAVPPIRLAILFTNFTALAFLIALFGFRILWVVPVARDKALHNMPYGMFILDAENLLADFNPAAQKLPGLPGKLVLRQAGSIALGDWWEQLAPLIGPEPALQDTVIQTSAGQQHFQVYSQPIWHASGWRAGQVLLLEDVTQARQAQQRQAETLWTQASFQEREQLATELHDGLSQSLAFLNLQAQTALMYVQSGESEAAQDCLVRLTDAAYELQENTRELIGHLLAVSKPMHNFRTTLHQILAEFQEQTSILICMETNGDGNPSTSIDSRLDTAHLSPAVAVQLVRIIQEALANVRKHAEQASRVTVQLKTGDEHVSLTITDDGAGFDQAELQNHGNHFGLQVIRQRATRIGGRATIFSEPGKGTRVEVYAPLSGGETRSIG
jgi:signal transduction histidine kinase